MSQMDEIYCAYPRYSNRSFPPIRRDTLEGAVSAGLSTGKPFDVHRASGDVAWTWEQRHALHDVQWHDVFRGSIEDPRECGWCETCGREVYDNEGYWHRRE